MNFYQPLQDKKLNAAVKLKNIDPKRPRHLEKMIRYVLNVDLISVKILLVFFRFKSI